MKNERKGFFGVLEGLTCTGKDEQAGIIFARGVEAGLRIGIEVEPTKGPFGQVARASIENRVTAPFAEAIAIAKALLAKFPDTRGRVIHILHQMQSGRPVSILEKQIIFMMDRLWHSTFLAQRLEAGETIICVRYELSTLAFGTSNGIELADLLVWQNRILGNCYIVPDLTGYIRIRPETAVARLDKNGKLKDMFETEPGVRRTATAYDRIIDFGREHKLFGKIVEIDGEAPIEKVTDSLLVELCKSSAVFKKLN